jgi:hypothetical protein
MTNFASTAERELKSKSTAQRGTDLVIRLLDFPNQFSIGSHAK